MQPELGARVRLLATGDVNKNDPDDARSVAVAALRSAGVREVRADDHAAVLKIWSKRHRDLGRTRTQVVCGLHAVLGELIPGGVPEVITSARAARVLKAIRPEGAVQAARCELAAALLEDLRRVDAGIRETRTKLAVTVAAAGTSLTGLFGVGPVIAAAVIGDVRDVSRFPGRDNFAAYNGTAPIEVSSGRRKVYRLSRRGNRRHGHAIHMAAITQIRRRHSKGRAYYDKKLAEGKTGKEALRALKRQVSNAIFACLQADAWRAAAPAEGPGGQQGNDSVGQRGRLAPQAPALRTSHSRARSPPYGHARRPTAGSRPRPGHSRRFLDRCHTAAGDAEGPGGAPAAKRGRTTWRYGKTTATPGREEGQGPLIKPPLTQRGIRSVCRGRRLPGRLRPSRTSGSGAPCWSGFRALGPFCGAGS